MHKNEVAKLNVMYKRIEELCKIKGVNMTQMCRETEIPRGNLTDLKMNRTVELSTKTLSKISVYFGVSLDYLLGHEETKKAPILQEDERSLTKEMFFAAFESADESTREAIRLLLKVK